MAVQFFAVGGAQQLNDKNGKKLAVKFATSNKFAVVIAKIRMHLPGDDNLVIFVRSMHTCYRFPHARARSFASSLAVMLSLLPPPTLCWGICSG